jgi:hypothetical protein
MAGCHQNFIVGIPDLYVVKIPTRLSSQVKSRKAYPLLTVNIHLPEPELEAIVRSRCAEFGTVKFIRLMPVAKNALHRFAFVRMSTLSETMDLANAAGGSTLGSGAVALRLEAAIQDDQKH